MAPVARGWVWAGRYRRRRANRLASLPIARDLEAPRTRGDCVDGIRPCPWVGCRHHLALEVNQVTGTMTSPGQRSLMLRGEDRSVEEWSDVLVDKLDRMEHTCSLDVADAGVVTLDAIGTMMGVVRERVRQVEEKALERVREACAANQAREP